MAKITLQLQENNKYKHNFVICIDKVPTFLLQEFDDLLPSLDVLCSWSIQDGVLLPFPKNSILVPVLKHSGLDSSDRISF